MEPSSVGEISVYFGGSVNDGPSKLFWYCVDTESLSQLNAMNPQRRKKKRRHSEYPDVHGVALDPVVELIDGYFGCSAIIGDHIYWFGLNRKTFSMDLFKHDCRDANRLSWNVISSNNKSFNCDAMYDMVAIPVGRKLYVLSGNDAAYCEDTTSWGVCEETTSRGVLITDIGAVYDLDLGTWESVICDISSRTPYYAPYVAFCEETNEILFYSLLEGSILFFNLSTRKWRDERSHRSLALWNGSCRHIGLSEYPFLQRATRYGGVLRDKTLYWFTGDLMLYGYDIYHKRWFQSKRLGEQFPTIQPTFDPANGDYGLFCTLMDLRNGKFMVLISDCVGRATVALLSVSTDKGYLSVTVESFHQLSLHHSFHADAGMSMLRNTGSGSMHGSVRSARET